ncbi:hydroxyethylthiazole kinase [Pseudarthrobacter sp. So.54]
MAIRYTSADCAQLLEELRVQSPLVQCLTNAVVSNFTANVLLAIGAARRWWTFLPNPGSSPPRPPRS